MKNFLVFRSAKHPIVNECIEKIIERYTDCTIWLCIQKECIDRYSKFENIRFIVFPNGMFSFENTIKDKRIVGLLKEVVFDDVYIPYSTLVPECEEIEKIILNILSIKKAVYYGRDGSFKKKKLEIIRISIEKFTKKFCHSLDYFFVKLIYILCFARR